MDDRCATIDGASHAACREYPVCYYPVIAYRVDPCSVRVALWSSGWTFLFSAPDAH